MTSKKMASKEGEKVVEKTEVDTEDTVDSDKTEGNNGDMQVLDEVLDNDDATGEEEYVEEVTENFEDVEDDLQGEEDEGEELEGDLGGEGEGEDETLEADEDRGGEDDLDKTGEDEESAEVKEGDDAEAEGKVKKEGDAEGQGDTEKEDDGIPRCPYGHKLREDTNSNRFGCTADDCRRKNDPNILASDMKSPDASREYKERLFLPNYKSFKIDLKVAAKVRSVMAGPLDLDDLQDEKVQEIINQAEEFMIRFHRNEDNKCTGHVQFRFSSFEEATAAVEKIEKVKEGLTVKQLVGGLNVGQVDKLIRGIDDDIEIPAERVKNLVSVCGIPTTTTKDQLLALFPQARIKLMAMKANGTPKGYAYIEMDDEEQARKLVEEHNKKPHTVEGHKLYLEKMKAPPELFMVIDSDDVLTEEERAKMVRTLNVSQMQLDRRGSRMKTREYQDLVRKVKMMKQQLANDNRKRREKGLPLPKTAMRRTTNMASRPSYGMNRPRGVGGWSSRPDNGRQRRDVPSLMRSPVQKGRPVYRSSRGRGSSAEGRYHSPPTMRSSSPRGEGYYSHGPSPNSRREMGPPRRAESDRGERFSSHQGERGSSRYAGGERGGRSGKLNTHQTANAVNMLVGLTSLISEMQRKTPGSFPERRHSSSSGVAGPGNRDRWQQSSYSERSRGRSASDYGAGSAGAGYSTASSYSREGGSSYREDWGTRSESMRSSGHGAGHNSYDDPYYDDRSQRKRTMSDRSGAYGQDSDYYGGRSDRGGPKRPKMMSRGRGGGPGRGRY